MPGLDVPGVKELLLNPEALREVTSDPAMASMLDSPEALRAATEGTPLGAGVRALRESNLLLDRVLDHPQLIRQVLNMLAQGNLLDDLRGTLSRTEETGGGVLRTQDPSDPTVPATASPNAIPLPNPWASRADPGEPASRGSAPVRAIRLPLLSSPHSLLPVSV